MNRLLFLMTATSFAALAFCAAAIADNPFDGGFIGEKDFLAAWAGPGAFPPEALSAASTYADSISDYSAEHCTLVWPGVLAYPCEGTIHVQGDALAQQMVTGAAICDTTIDGEGYCTGKMLLIVDADYIDHQTTWCHEIGHAMGAAHDSERGDCLDSWNNTSTTYHSHHISVHLQY